MPLDITKDGAVKYKPLPSKITTDILNDLCWIFLGYTEALKRQLSKYYTVSDPIFDDHALKDVIIRVNKYVEHAKIFHKIEKANEFRNLAVYCYWIIKLHPFSISIDLKEDCNPKDLIGTAYYDKNGANINEAFAVYLLMSTINRLTIEKKINFPISKEYVTEILYTLRYRDVDKNAMILLFKPIMDI